MAGIPKTDIVALCLKFKAQNKMVLLTIQYSPVNEMPQISTGSYQEVRLLSELTKFMESTIKRVKA